MRARSGVSVSDSWKPQQQVLNSLNSCVKVSVRRRTEKGLRTSIQCAKLTLSNTCLVRFPRSTLLSPEQKQERHATRQHTVRDAHHSESVQPLANRFGFGRRVLICQTKSNRITPSALFGLFVFGYLASIWLLPDF